MTPAPHTTVISRNALMWGLSAIHTGLEQIKKGQVEDGAKGVERGLTFLQNLVEPKNEARSA